MCICHVDEHFVGWKNFAERLLESTTVDTFMGKAASNLLSLIDEPKLYLDMTFVKGFSNCFFESQMGWLQDHDPVAQDYGFRSHDVSVRAFELITEFKDLFPPSSSNTARWLRKHLAEMGLSCQGQILLLVPMRIVVEQWPTRVTMKMTTNQSDPPRQRPTRAQKKRPRKLKTRRKRNRWPLESPSSQETTMSDR